MVDRFMWNGRMEDILRDEAEKHSEAVRKFTKGDALVVYESPVRDMDNDIKVRSLFDEARGLWEVVKTGSDSRYL